MTTKQYLRFTPAAVFGVIASATAKIVQFESDDKQDIVSVPGCENVMLWNLAMKEKFMVLKGEISSVSCLAIDFYEKNIAVGYTDGIIRIFDVKSGKCTISFCGHKTAVSCLTFDCQGANLASGGKDSEIVIWNVTDQTGLFRLKGHKGPISKCHFFKQRNVLISSSKDTFIKFWDLDTQHCFQTLLGNRNEILDFIIIKDTRLITGINGPDLKVWDLFLSDDDSSSVSSPKRPRLEQDDQENNAAKTSDSEEELQKETENVENSNFKYCEVGKILTVGDKTVSLLVDKTERVMGCHASTKTLQVYKILNADEISKKFKKRKRKENKLKQKEGTSENNTTEVKLALKDEFEHLQPIQTPAKIDSFSCIVKNDCAKIVVLMKNNSVASYSLDISTKNSEVCECPSIVSPGHRSVVRALSFSTDGMSILSASEESIKIWKSFRNEQTCTHTMNCDFALCCSFVTGNNYCIVGTKNGKLQLFDVNSRELVENVDSHEGSVNCLAISPDQCGVTSGGSDKDIKFWDFELVRDEDGISDRKRLTLEIKRTLKMSDEVLCLRYSPDKNKLAVALLDNTVQVLFTDTLKLAFSLYGHVLPVRCMDISYDSTLIATGSEDKDIRIWSMEFGSCNKFIKRAHDKGITCLRFLPKTHMFFTGGRDNVVKQWDADIFQKIITLKGHQGDVTALAINPDGGAVVSASRDKSLRIWEKTSEILVLEEEQEIEREEEEASRAEDLPVVPGEVNKEVGLPGMKTLQMIKTVDQLIEAIDVYKEETKKLQEHEIICTQAGKQVPLPTPHPLLTAYSATSPIMYMKKVVERIKTSELEGTLLHLPFNYVLDFLKILSEFVQRGWESEFCERCTSFLVRIHMGQILSTDGFKPIIAKLKDGVFKSIYHAKDSVGFALTVSQCHQREIEAQEVPLFTGILESLQEKRKKSRKKLQRSIVTFV